jgi:hypothetical protein
MQTDSRRAKVVATAAAADTSDTKPVFSAAATLDAWTTRDWSDGLDLTALTGLAAIEVITRRSVYHIVPTGAAGEHQVRGGHFLPTFQRARAIGCSMGGALLKQHAIHLGFRMEIVFEDMRLVTSEVTHIRVLPEQNE